MAETIAQIIPYVPQAAWPVILVVGLYLYINKQRKDTKNERDTDSLSIHDTLIKHGFQIQALKDADLHKSDVLEDLRTQISTMNVEIAKLSVSIDNLTRLLEKK